MRGCACDDEDTMTRRPAIARTTLAASVLSFGALAMAQSPAPPNIAAPQGEQRQAPAAADEVKVTGCLTAAANAGAVTGEANNASPFLLKTTPAATSDAVAYALQPATPEVKLQAHAGHKVEITGRPAGTADALSKPQSNEGVSTSQPSGSTGMETIPPPSGKTLLVSSVRMISSSCR
jgi:hypothetical protein